MLDCIGTYERSRINGPTAPQDVEMEDLNFYYASYSRQVGIPVIARHYARSHSASGYTTMSSRSGRGLATCRFYLTLTLSPRARTVVDTSFPAAQDQALALARARAVRQDFPGM